MGFHEVILLILSILFNIHIFLIQNGVDKHFVSNEMRTEKLYNRLLRSFKLLLLKNFLYFFLSHQENFRLWNWLLLPFFLIHIWKLRCIPSCSFILSFSQYGCMGNNALFPSFSLSLEKDRFKKLMAPFSLSSFSFIILSYEDIQIHKKHSFFYRPNVWKCKFARHSQQVSKIWKLTSNIWEYVDSFYIKHNVW